MVTRGICGSHRGTHDGHMSVTTASAHALEAGAYRQSRAHPGSKKPLPTPSLAVVLGDNGPDGRGSPGWTVGQFSPLYKCLFPSPGMRDFGYHHENVL